MTDTTIFEAPAPDVEARLRIVRRARVTPLSSKRPRAPARPTSSLRRSFRRVMESRPPLSLSRTAALTFTEKAAGEMKIRLRRALERDRLLRRCAPGSRRGSPPRARPRRSDHDSLLLPRPPPRAALRGPASIPISSSSIRPRPPSWRAGSGMTGGRGRSRSVRQARSRNRSVAVSRSGASRRRSCWSLSQMALALYNERTRLDDAGLSRARSCGNAAAPRIVKRPWRFAIAEARSPGRGCDRLPARHPWPAFLDSLSASHSLEQLADRGRPFPGGAFHGASTALGLQTGRRSPGRVRRKAEGFLRRRRFPGAVAPVAGPRRGARPADRSGVRVPGCSITAGKRRPERPRLRRPPALRPRSSSTVGQRAGALPPPFGVTAVDEFQDTDPLQMEILLRLGRIEGRRGRLAARSSPSPGGSSSSATRSNRSTVSDGRTSSLTAPQHAV